MNSKELAYRIRKHAIEMTNFSKASHIGAILSITDIIAVLYNEVMKIDPNNPLDDSRDRFILSKGHAGVAVYSALAEKGFFELEELNTYYQNGSKLSGHVSHKNVNGVEFSTGSLGHGVCVAIGMALAAKKNKKNHRVFTIVGDGECNEGSVWEGALFAQQFKLSNLTVIVDHNKLQGIEACENVLNYGDLAEKWRAFNWNVIEIDGHDYDQIKNALTIIDESRPTCIIANTIKGKGVSFMENQILWHYRCPVGEDFDNAMKELEENR